jgi:hypothetical protein
MQLLSWLPLRTEDRRQTRHVPARKPAPRSRPQLETLENREVPSFSAPVSYTVPYPQALAVADMNGDGKPDLVTLARIGGGNTILLNNGNGTFGTASGFFDSNQPTAIAVGDGNGDGKTDVVLANSPSNYPTNIPSDLSVTVLLGNGQARPLPAPGEGIGGEPILPGGSISAMALADVNGDSKPDLIAVDKLGGRLFVARNDGNGFFAVAQTYKIPWNPGSSGPCGLAVADVNGDGKPDIIVTDPRLNSVSVLLNNGNGTFAAAQTYAVGADPAAVALGDVNGDGKPDIVTANTNGTVSVLTNLGSGTLGAAQSYAVGGPANSVALADFNHDGRLDIATTGSTETDVLLNTGTGTFAAYQKVGPAGKSVVAADFNGDGYPDLAEIGTTANTVKVLLNNANW